MASRIVLAVPALLLSLSLVACDDAPATTSPSEPASVAASSDAPSAGNRTERCVENFDRGTDYFPDEVEFTEAAGVEVTYEDNYKVVRVKRPWVGAKQPLTYVLVQCGTPAPELDAKVTGVIEVPARRIVSMSTTNLPALEMLDSVDRLVGVGTAAYVYSPEVRRLLKKGDVVETGENAQADLERLG